MPRAVVVLVSVLLALSWAVAVRGQEATAGVQAPGKPAPVVWEERLAGVEEPAYAAAVRAVVERWEADTGRKVAPGPLGRVGLKVYSGSGAGAATPPALVRAVAGFLEGRGFARSGIFLMDTDELRLREAGLLPALSERSALFDGMEVKVLATGRYFDPRWFYDSALPARVDLSPRDELAASGRPPGEDDRKSYLAAPLLFEVDFWINLPVYTDHPMFGVNGALANATLWNASNTLRFFRTPATAPAAIAEMAAIPELRLTWVFTLVTLDRWQFIGGPSFNSLYTRSEPKLWLSEDPVLLDALMAVRMNEARKAEGFEPLPADLRMLVFAEQLGVGTREVAAVQWRR